MASTRKKYDTGAYQDAIRQSTGALHYLLEPAKHNQCQPCRPAEPGYLGQVGVSLPKDQSLINVDSEVRGLNYPLTNDESKKFNPNRANPNVGEDVQVPWHQQTLYHLPECNITTEYTHQSIPKCFTRETGVNRFDPLYLNPQDENRWLPPFPTQVNYNAVVKDNWRPCIPTPMDPSPALPQGDKLDQCIRPRNYC